MPKAPVTKAKKAKPKSKGIDSNAIILECDLDDGAWPKFEGLIKSAAKMGPKPHKAESIRPLREARKDRKEIIKK